MNAATLAKLIAALPAEQRKALARLLDPAAAAVAAGGKPEVTPLAVIGIGCRLPSGLRGAAAFFSFLRQGGDAISEIPGDRWDAAAMYTPDPETPGKITTRFGGFVPDVADFDADYFGISPREALWMDPQQRLLLEVSIEALEDAGQVPARLSGSRTGVFVGMCSSDYMMLSLDRLKSVDAYACTGVSHAIAANRLSYQLDLRGPSLALDTACSSSLVAIHLASQSLQLGECDLAIVGGVNAILSPAVMVSLSRWGMMAKDGRCKVFDARADGWGRAEGCGVVVLKRLSDARADGDPIRAVLRGTAMNQDGRTTGLTAPNPAAQKAVILQALQKAGVAAAQVGFVETHGTGTALGDPIEVEALAETYGVPATPEAGPCYLGSVKANLGHLEGGAGVTGFIKAVLSVQHGVIAPQPHFRSPSPNFRLAGTRLCVPTAEISWPSSAQPRRAAVSSFGFGGVNAHVVLEEVRAEARAALLPTRPLLLPLSARSPAALRALVASYVERLQSPDAPTLVDICHTAGARRSHYEHRLALGVETLPAASAQLTAWLRGQAPQLATDALSSTRPPGLVFVFSGQGSQWPGMCRQLIAKEPVFCRELQAAATAVAKFAELDLMALLQAADGADAARLEDIDALQPALFAVSVALAALWRSLGITPQAVVGHSMGEVAAAYVSGALSLEDAARVICTRSRLLRRKSGQGAMALFELDAATLRAELGQWATALAIAACNSPRSTVLSGEPAAIEAALAHFAARGVFCRRIRVDVASHSAQMDELRGELLQDLAGLQPRAAPIPIYSTVSGAVIDGKGLDASYFVRNLREPVLFEGAIAALLASGYGLFVELSPHPILLPAIEEILYGEVSDKSARCFPSIKREHDEQRVIVETLGGLYAAGQPVDFSRINPPGRCVPLPSYPWQHRRYSLPGPVAAQSPKSPDSIAASELLPLSEPPGALLWQTELAANQPSYLDEHRVRGARVVPAAFFLSLVDGAAQRLNPGGGYTLRNVGFPAALVLGEKSLVLQLLLTPSSGTPGGRFHFQLMSRIAESGGTTPLGWLRHAEGELLLSALATRRATTRTALAQRCQTALAPQQLYRWFAERGVEYGDGFRRIVKLWTKDSEGLAELADGREAASEPASGGFAVALFDAALQCAAAPALAAENRAPPTGLYVPAGIAEMVVHGALKAPLWTHAEVHSEPAELQFGADLTIFNDAGVVIEIRGLIGQQLAERTVARLAATRSAYKLDFAPAPVLPSPSLPAPQIRRWLLCGASALADELAASLRARGETVYLVRRGAEFWPLADDCFVLDPERPEHCQQLIDMLAKAGGPTLEVVFGWGLATPAAPDSDSVIGDAQVLTRQLLVLLRVLAGAVGRCTLALLTRAALPWGLPSQGLMQPALAQAPLIGFLRAARFEHPGLRCRHLDLGTADANEARRTLSWLDSAAPADLVLRGEAGFVEQLSPIEPSREDPPPIRPDGTYLVTGGLGGLGLRVAAWLIAHGARHLCLVGRGSRLDAAADALVALSRPGVQIDVVHADIASPDELSKLLAALRCKGPPLRGVIHCAGVLADSMLTKLTEAQLATVLAPKLQGSWQLHLQTLADPIELFVLFSSVAAVLGAPAQCNYAAANAFLGALAHLRRGRGLPALCIHWGAWAEVGLAAQSGHAQHHAQHGMNALSPEEGVALLELAMGSRETELLAMAADWERFFQANSELASTPLFAQLAARSSRLRPEPGSPTLSREGLHKIAPGQRLNVFTEQLSARLAPLFGIAATELPVDRPLGSLGLDSLVAVKIKNLVDRELDIRLPVAKLYQGLSLRQLADDLLGQLFETADGLSRSVAAVKQDTAERGNERRQGDERLQQLRRRRRGPKPT